MLLEPSTRQTATTRFAGAVGPPAAGVAERLGVHAGPRARLLRWSGGDAEPVEVGPIGCPGRQLRLGFTGRIDNADEILQALRGRSHTFGLNGDAELVAHAYEEWGDECVSRLWGAFAFALWDEREQVLLLARDRAGARPIFYCELKDGFAFASHLSVLRDLLNARWDVDPQAVDCYLTFQDIPAPLTIYRQARKLPAAHLLQVRNVTPSLRRYWSLDFGPKEAIGVQEAARRLDDLLVDAIARAAEGRRCAIMLSGGLDSAILLRTMSSVTALPVRTLTFAFADNAADTSAARTLAHAFGADHRVFHVATAGILEALTAIASRYEQPSANPSALTAHYVAPFLVGQGVPIFTGDGADEIFGGRERHVAAAMVAHLRRLPAHRLFAAVGARLPMTRMRLFFEGLTLPASERHVRWVGALSATAKADLYTPEFSRAVDAGYPLRLVAGLTGAAAEPLDHALAADYGLWIPENLWATLGASFVAAGAEIRAPFLDHRIVEFAARLPASLRVSWWTSKVLLRRAYAGRLPLRRRGGTAAAPKIALAPLLRGELRPVIQEVLLAPDAMARGYFRPAVLRRIAADHLSGKSDRSRHLWALLMLELWHRRWLSR